MNVIAKISCFIERSVVILKLHKEYLNTVTYNTPCSLTPDNIVNSPVYRTLFYVNIYGSFKLSKNNPVFWLLISFSSLPFYAVISSYTNDNVQ